MSRAHSDRTDDSPESSRDALSFNLARNVRCRKLPTTVLLRVHFCGKREIFTWKSGKSLVSATPQALEFD
jgi:hypothetical protein